jgi:cation transport protein ChaC
MQRIPFTHLSATVRRASLEATLALAPDPQRIWVFAYGSLMWRPCFKVVATRPAVVDGFERSFCVWTVEARGTPACPGLGLGLRAGRGRCEGLVLRIDARQCEAGLEALWDREMLTGVYRPQWMATQTPRGLVQALGFVVNRVHPQYAGDLDPLSQAQYIASASGTLGSCRDYLHETIAALAAAGIRDDGLDALRRLVEAVPKQP